MLEPGFASGLPLYLPEEPLWAVAHLYYCMEFLSTISYRFSMWCQVRVLRLMLSVNSGEQKNVRREKLKDSLPRNSNHSH